MESLTCIRCGNSWSPRKSGRPVRCPACYSRQWDQRATDGDEAASAVAGSGSVDARRVVLDAEHAARVCGKCEHEWEGPKYKHCPACDRPRWWEPRQLTKAEQKVAGRQADAERWKAEKQRQEGERARQEAEHEHHELQHDILRHTYSGIIWIPWARAFDRAWRDHEDRAEADRLQAVEAAEHERWQAQERAEHEREVSRKLEAKEQADREVRARAAEDQRLRERALRSQAAQAASRNAWLDARWHRRPCATAAQVAERAAQHAVPAIVLAVIVVASILVLEYAVKPMLDSQDGIIQRFRPDEVAPSLALTPTPIPQNITQTEEYWLERRHRLQEGFDFWVDAITARTSRGKELPNNVTLAYARDSLEYFRTELHTTNLRLAGFADGNN